MAALDERDDGLAGVFLENFDGGPGGVRGFVAVAEPIDDCDESAAAEDYRQVQITGHGLARGSARGDSPFDTGPELQRGRAHSTHPFPHCHPGSFANLRLDLKL